MTSQKHEKAPKGAFKSFVVPELSKADADDFFDQVKPHVKALTESQLKERQSTKFIMTLWVRWKKPMKSLLR